MTGNDTVQAVLSIGSNIGDRRENIENAVKLLAATPGISNVRLSGMYETEPVGYEDQDFFYNICVLIDTTLAPMELLARAQEIEQELHRVRIIRWGPRTIDVDIILYGDIEMDTERLTIPHPRYRERAFVLIPMMDLTGYDGDVPEDKSVKRIPWEFEV